MRNIELKVAILRSGKKAYEIAQKLGWHPTRLSQILSGVYIPTSDERDRLAEVVGVPVEDVFLSNPPIEAA
jgi:transcriptional regulator with XRE-family HTH domain